MFEDEEVGKGIMTLGVVVGVVIGTAGVEGGAVLSVPAGLDGISGELRGGVAGVEGESVGSGRKVSDVILSESLVSSTSWCKRELGKLSSAVSVPNCGRGVVVGAETVL